MEYFLPAVARQIDITGGLFMVVTGQCIIIVIALLNISTRYREYKEEKIDKKRFVTVSVLSVITIITALGIIWFQLSPGSR